MHILDFLGTTTSDLNKVATAVYFKAKQLLQLTANSETYLQQVADQFDELCQLIDEFTYARRNAIALQEKCV
jgi:hypothetical protein